MRRSEDFGVQDGFGVGLDEAQDGGIDEAPDPDRAKVMRKAVENIPTFGTSMVS